MDENKMIERGAQPGIDKKIEPGRGSNAYQVDTNHKPGISRRNFIKFMGAAAAVTLGELDLSQIVGAQEIRTSGRHGLEMFALGEREAEVYDSFNEGLVPIVITKTNDDSQLEITVPIDLQTSYVYKEDGSLSIINTKTGETESVDSSEFSDAVGQQISVVKIWNQDNNWVRLEDLETSLLVNRGRAGMIIKTKRGLNMGGESRPAGSVIVFQSDGSPMFLDKEEVVGSKIVVAEIGQQLAGWVSANHGITMMSDELTIAQVDALTNRPCKLLLDNQWVSIPAEQEVLRIERQHGYLPTPDRLIPFLERENFNNGLEGGVYKVYYSNAFMRDVAQMESLRIRDPWIMDDIWNYMLSEVHRQSGLGGRTIKLTTLVQDAKSGTKSDSGEIEMEVERATQYVVTRDEFKQIMSALIQENRDYVFYQEWRSGGTRIGANTLAYDAGNGELVMVVEGYVIREYSGEIMAASQLTRALIMLTNSATWAVGRRMDWHYSSDQSAQIYSRLDCNRMDTFCTTEGDFVNIE